jgi:hypothetical protein
MKQPASCCCRCGVCSFPIAYGVLRSQYDLIENFSIVQGGTGNGSLFRTQYGNNGFSHSMIYPLVDTDGINAEYYVCTKGYEGPLDVLMLGHPVAPTIEAEDSLFYLPTIASTEDDAVKEYLASGGIVLLNVSRTLSATTRLTAINAYLENLGSTTRLKTAATFSDDYLDGKTLAHYGMLTPLKSLWALNPDTWLTSSNTYAQRVLSLWDHRMRLDARRQLGPDQTTFGSPSVNQGNYTTLDAGEAAAAWYDDGNVMPIFGTHTHTAALIVADEENYLSASRWDKVGFSSSTAFSSTTHLSISGGTGAQQHYRFRKKSSNEIERDIGATAPAFAKVAATAERLEGGGKLIVSGGTSGAAQGLTSHYIHWLLRYKLHSSCNLLTRGLAETQTP